jgi:hypothetical protein
LSQGGFAILSIGAYCGHATQDQLRLAVIPRNQIPELKKKGLSNKKIAKLTGVSDMTVARDLAATNVVENATNVAPAPIMPSGRFETIVIDPPPQELRN